MKYLMNAEKKLLPMLLIKLKEYDLNLQQNHEYQYP